MLPTTHLSSPRPLLGISMDEVALVRVPIGGAIIEGARETVQLTRLTIVGLAQFVVRSFSGKGGLAEVAGPVGLVGIVGNAAHFGFAYLLTLVALISINLGVLNLVPFPALDGGRLLFLGIEGVKGSPLNPKIATALNNAGFALLVLLMFVVTWHDLARLVSG